jgi:hypothetical protein
MRMRPAGFFLVMWLLLACSDDSADGGGAGAGSGGSAAGSGGLAGGRTGAGSGNAAGMSGAGSQAGTGVDPGCVALCDTLSGKAEECVVEPPSDCDCEDRCANECLVDATCEDIRFLVNGQDGMISQKLRVCFDSCPD